MTTFSMHPALNPSADDGVLAPLNLDFGQPFTGQVVEFFEKAGDLRRFDEFVLPGQAVGAILALPLLEMSSGMPVLTLYGFGQERGSVVVTGQLALGDYRQNVVRPRRADLPSYPEVDTFDGYTVLDGGSRGLTEGQIDELCKLLACSRGYIRVLDLATGHVNMANPTEGMVDKVIATGVTRADLTSGGLLYLPAGNGLVAALQATTIYGLSEAWPKTIRLNRRGDGSFGVDEVVDPQALRQTGVQLGAQWRAGEAPIPVSRDMLSRIANALSHYEPTDRGGLLGEVLELLKR